MQPHDNVKILAVSDFLAVRTPLYDGHLKGNIAPKDICDVLINLIRSLDPREVLYSAPIIHGSSYYSNVDISPTKAILIYKNFLLFECVLCGVTEQRPLSVVFRRYKPDNRLSTDNLIKATECSMLADKLFDILGEPTQVRTCDKCANILVTKAKMLLTKITNSYISNSIERLCLIMYLVSRKTDNDCKGHVIRIFRELKLQELQILSKDF